MKTLMHIIFFIKERFTHPNLMRGLRECVPLDGVSRSELLSTVDKKLTRLLLAAVRDVPYYRALAEKGRIDRDNPKLEQFPIISKADIRGHEDEFISCKYGKGELGRTRTSGSTGEPFMFYRGKGEWDASYAALWRGLFRLGIRMGDKRAFVKGVNDRPRLSLLMRLKRKLYEIVNRCIVIDAHFLALSEQNVFSAIERIRRYRPVYLHGYVSSIDLLAATAEQHGISLCAIGVKMVVTESEKLYDFQRDRIGRVFNCKVMENYGCVEVGMIAQPDGDGNLCVNEDHVLLEVDADGSAVITNLDGFAFPFIRCKNGDCVTLREEKRSRLPYAEIERVDGRKTDMIRLPQGGALQGFIVMHPLYKHGKYLKAYQVYQPDLTHLIIRISAWSEIPQSILSQIMKEMAGLVGPDVMISVEFRDEIPLSKRGKRLFICSDVKEIV